MRVANALAAMTAVLVSATPTVRSVPAPSATNTTAANNTTVYSFSDSCNEYKVHQINEDVWLMASCRNNTGDWPYSQINLNQ